MELYRTGYGGMLISRVEVEKYDKKSVWIKDADGSVFKEKKHSGFNDFWETLNEAKKHLRESINENISRHRQGIKKHQSALIELKKY
tara:strand:+ start:2754 stop:3014 length:261 start_codon:yes stop_codon:yes gene_type:complete